MVRVVGPFGAVQQGVGMDKFSGGWNKCCKDRSPFCRSDGWQIHPPNKTMQKSENGHFNISFNHNTHVLGTKCCHIWVFAYADPASHILQCHAIYLWRSLYVSTLFMPTHMYLVFSFYICTHSGTRSHEWTDRCPWHLPQLPTNGTRQTQSSGASHFP